MQMQNATERIKRELNPAVTPGGISELGMPELGLPGLGARSRVRRLG